MIISSTLVNVLTLLYPSLFPWKSLEYQSALISENHFAPRPAIKVLNFTMWLLKTGTLIGFHWII